MAQPVWVLSVDLQTKTATFQSGMADAAKSARNAFGEIKSGVGGMSSEIEHRSIDVRHSIGLVDNFIRGAHAQAIADLIRMYGKSAIVMSALPLAATAAGIGLIGGIAYEVYEKMHKLAEEEEKVADDTVKFGTVANAAFRALDDKLLSAEHQADELSGNHLAALQKQLILIDHASMNELVRSFGLVEKSADVLFADLKGHWYSLGIGSDGAKHALDQFQIQYESLLAQSKSKDASDLLGGTLASAERILAAQKEAKANMGAMLPEAGSGANINAWLQANQALKQAGVGFTDAEIKSQQQLVDTLKAQQQIEQTIAALKKEQSGNATKQTHAEIAAQSAAAAKEAAAAQLSVSQSALAGEKATADAKLAIHHASLEELLQSDLDFAEREYQIKEAANQTDIAALNKSGKDYQLQLKTLNDKSLDIQQQYSMQVASLKAHAAEAINQRDTQAIEQGIREQIEATQDGTAARVAAIDAGIREEQARHLQDTNFYKGLLNQRVEAAGREAQQEADTTLKAGLARAKITEQMAEEQASHRTAMATISQSTSPSNLVSIALEKSQMEAVYSAKRAELGRELALYKNAGQQKLADAQRVQEQLTQLDKKHTDQSAELDQQSAQSERAALASIGNSYAQTFFGILQGRQTMTQAMGQLADQGISKLITAAIQEMALNKSQQLSYAELAAAKAFSAMSHIPVVGPELGAIAAAAVFAGAMAFEKGGIVPGVGRGDIVPAMLTPGEAILPKAMTDHLMTAARSGNTGGGIHNTVHVHYRVNASALDGDGMATVLEKHSDQLRAHFENTLRKMNR